MRSVVAFISLNVLIFCAVYSQKSKPDETLKFTDKYSVFCTSVKNQHNSGTCWSFAAVSFVEAELLRIKKTEYDLSEMFFVNYAYKQKALDYVSYQGKTNFSEGGQAHDVLNIINHSGIAPESAYDGLNYGEKMHDHNEFSAMLTAMLKSILNIQGSKLTTAWNPAICSVIDTYLGEIPENFVYNDKNFTPISFSGDLGIITEDYVEVSSYNQTPFYEWFILKIPDNWSRDKYINLPLDEMMSLIDNALMNGYSVCWDGDVSEQGFAHKYGLALVPEKPIHFLSPEEKEKYFNTDRKESSITQETRQLAFENLSATDDHLMHLVGISFDSNGKKYYKTKNSWGTESNSLGGYLYMSESYVRLNTVAVMVHKDAVPAELKNKIKW